MQSIFDTTRDFVHKHAFAAGLFLAFFAFCFFAGGLVVVNGQTVEPTDSHVVTLMHKGEVTDIPTRAQTVGDFLANADIKLNEGDLVEPAVDTPIDEDNFRVHVYRARPVLIDDGQKQMRVLSPHQSARLIAEKAGYEVFPEDKVSLAPPDNVLSEPVLGEKLTIDRATPVTLSLYGAPAVTIRTQASTVGELLKERNITPEDGATLTPAADSPLAPNMGIFISKFGKQVVSVEEKVPFATETTNDPNLLLGRVEVRTPGQEGKKQVTYEIDLRDGREIGRRVLQETVVLEPVKQVQVRGTKSVAITGDKFEWMRAAGIPESQMSAADYIIGRESGWRPNALNAGGCAGLGQACPGSKLASVCPNWQVDPVCQLKFFSGYANNRYGSWQGAYNFWIVNKWW